MLIGVVEAPGEASPALNSIRLQPHKTPISDESHTVKSRQPVDRMTAANTTARDSVLNIIAPR